MRGSRRAGAERGIAPAHGGWPQALEELRELARSAPAGAGRARADRAAARAGAGRGGGALRRSAEAVAVLDPLALRARRVRALFLCGLQEGVFPAPARPEPYLSEEERRGLAEASGLRLGRAGDRHAGGGALPAVRGDLAPAGAVGAELAHRRRRRPAGARSLFVDDVCDLFAGDLHADALRRRRALRRGLFVAPAARARRGPPRPPEPGASRRRIGPLRDPRVLAELGEQRLWSASGLQSWAGCPVQWFVERMLGARDLEPEAEPLARGGLAHAALRQTLEGLREETGSARLTTERLPRARELLRAALEEHEREHPLSTVPRARARGAPAAGGRPGALPRARRGVRRSADAASSIWRSKTPRASWSRPIWSCPSASQPAPSPGGPTTNQSRLDLAEGVSTPREPGWGGGRQMSPLGCCRRWTSARACWCGASSTAWTSRRGERRSCTTTRAAHRAPPDRWLGERSFQIALYMRAVEQLPGRARGGGLLPAALRPRPARAGGARARRGRGARVRAGRRAPARGGAGAGGGDPSRAARAAAAQARAGQLEPRPATCGFGGADACTRRSAGASTDTRAAGRAPMPEQPWGLDLRQPRLSRPSRSRRRRAAAVRCCSPPGPAAARPRCWSSASCGRCARTASPRRGSWRSPSPSAPPRSCASGCARACWSWASARPRATPRAPRSAPSTASARGCCASTPSPPASTPSSRSSTRPARRGCASSPFAVRSPTLLAESSAARAAVDLLAAYGADRVQRMVLGVYAEQRSRGVSRPALPDSLVSGPSESAPLRCSPRCSTSSRCPTGSRWSLTRSSWRRSTHVCCWARSWWSSGRLRDAQAAPAAALDFDDLELCARDLLERHEGVRRAWSERIELLMVDEFQDTNRRQLALLELLERDNLFTVGDELQSIYGFRHAEVEIFRERRRRLHAEGAAIALAHNFRSRPPLIAAINGVFGERFGDAYTPLIARARAGPRGHAGDRAAAHRQARLGGVAPTPGASPGRCRSATLWRQAEARLLAQRVAELVAGGQAAAGDVAVLLRAATDLPVYERALEERGLRTLAAVGSFWGHQQVGDLLAWLRALANPLDELALYSVLASPLVGISSDGLALVALQARARGTGAWATIARSATGELLQRASPPPTASAWRASPSTSPPSASAAPTRSARRAAAARDRPQRLRTARALAPVGRATVGQHPQAAAPRSPLRGRGGPRPAGLPRPRRAAPRALPRAPSPTLPPAPSPTRCA